MCLIEYHQPRQTAGLIAPKGETMESNDDEFCNSGFDLVCGEVIELEDNTLGKHNLERSGLCIQLEIAGAEKVKQADR